MSKRLRFFLGHVFISFIIACVVLYFVFMVWYPAPLASATGVITLFLMMLAIDVIVGPLLTLFIYKEGKKNLTFDLAIIIAIQVSALLYGLFSIAQGRPAWIVFYKDSFELVRANEQYIDKNEKVPEAYQSVSWWGPKYVGVKLSEDAQQRYDDLFIELGGISIAQRPARYLDFKKISDDMHNVALNLKDLHKFNTSHDVDMILKKYPEADSWLPLIGSKLDMVVLINKEKAEVIKIVNLRPWN